MKLSFEVNTARRKNLVFRFGFAAVVGLVSFSVFAKSPEKINQIPTEAAVPAMKRPEIKKSEWALQIFLPGLQYRFEDESNQNRQYHRYDHYSLGFEYKSLLFEAQISTATAATTGNASLNVSTKYSEYMTYLGYVFYRYDDLKYLIPDSHVDLFVQAGAGSTKTTVQTSLLGVSQSDESKNYLVFGMMGGLRAIILKYGLLQTVLGVQNSAAYAPENLFIVTVKAGVYLTW